MPMQGPPRLANPAICAIPAALECAPGAHFTHEPVRGNTQCPLPPNPP